MKAMQHDLQGMWPCVMNVHAEKHGASRISIRRLNHRTVVLSDQRKTRRVPKLVYNFTD